MRMNLEKFEICKFEKLKLDLLQEESVAQIEITLKRSTIGMIVPKLTRHIFLLSLLVIESVGDYSRFSTFGGLLFSLLGLVCLENMYNLASKAVTIQIVAASL